MARWARGGFVWGGVQGFQVRKDIIITTLLQLSTPLIK